MNNKIKVLVLDDNIHVEHYALEDKTYSSLEEFVARELRKPHSQEYEFRTVCLDFNIEDDFFDRYGVKKDGIAFITTVFAKYKLIQKQEADRQKQEEKAEKEKQRKLEKELKEQQKKEKSTKK